MPNPIVFFDMSIGGSPAGRIEMEVRRRAPPPRAPRPAPRAPPPAPPRAPPRGAADHLK